MKNIVAVSGSPKTKDSTSANIINRLAGIIEAPVTEYRAARLIRQPDIQETLAEILKTDILLMVFPLYVDALPAPLVGLMTLLEQAVNTGAAASGADLVLQKNPVKVYAVCNCGFVEPDHIRPALDIIENFCIGVNMEWCGGLGIGGGGFAASQNTKIQKGPAAGIHAALQSYGRTIAAGKETGNVFESVKIPRFFYCLGGNLGWRQLAKKNKTSRELWARPYENQEET
ncbi:MAG: hypothetical protein FWD78_03175 [Treponema sp.]|nr:hypothetical protein [Treponema sp.]